MNFTFICHLWGHFCVFHSDSNSSNEKLTAIETLSENPLVKFTPTSLTVNQLFGSANEQYVIPTYQRRYSWTEKQIWDLIEDIDQIDGSDQHLLGSVVCLAKHHKAGVNQLELVDGQQRLTTIVILLECIRQRLQKDGTADEVYDIDNMLRAKPPGGKPVSKILLDSIDAGEFRSLIAADAESGEFKNRRLVRAFEIVRKEVTTTSIEKLRSFVYKLQNQALIIRLDVSDARDAFKLFETINNRGLRLSPTDIIKNFLLGNAARFGETKLSEARRSWSQLLVHLDDTNSDAFFRYYLMSLLRFRIRKSEVVSRFKDIFMTKVAEAAKLPDRHNYADVDDQDDEELGESDETTTAPIEVSGSEKMSFENFLAQLVLCAKNYSELIHSNTSDRRVNRRLRNLRMIKAVQTYGFLMHLRVGGCSEKDFREVLRFTESFVLRRHVCRERANDTEALFARLCAVDPKAPLLQTREEYRALCPTDEKFRSEFASASFSANLIERARYCLETIEAAKHGKHDELQVLGSEDVHVEHIMPQKIKTKRAKDEYGDWVSYLGTNSEALHLKFVDRIGNMTLFAGALNIGASNNPFARKKTAYKESAILLTQALLKFSNFKFKEIEKRSADLAEIAISLWPRP